VRRQRLGERKVLETITEPCDLALQLARMEGIAGPREPAALGRAEHT
jgi:hypothetical protein